MNELASDVGYAFVRALRLLFMRPVNRFAAEPSRGAIAVLIIVAIAAVLLLEATAAGENRYVSGWGALVAVGSWLVYATMLWLAKPRYAPFGLTRILADVAALFGLIVPLATLVFVISKHDGAEDSWVPFFVFWAIMIWFYIAIWRAGWMAWTGSQWRYGFRPVMYSIAIAILMPDIPMVRGDDTQAGFDVWKIGHGWYDYYSVALSDEVPADTASEVKRANVERTYYKQPRLVDEALDTLLPSDAKRTDIYFLAAAGDAHQDVFKSEVEKAKELFDTRFGTAGRSILAINHDQTADTTPLANVSNFNRLLAGIARKMDTDNDVLVMFLTSHGMPDRFSINYSGFSLNDLSPNKLRTMLDASGIKNRVLIISACYSGSFIDELADDNTLIMTASSDSRTSFGCSNEREWTFFGDALFNHALRETLSFEAAFAKARETVSQWERDGGIMASLPQMSAGPAIHAKLKEVADTLARQQVRQEAAASDQALGGGEDGRTSGEAKSATSQ